MALLGNIKTWITSESSRNKNVALLAGFLFFTGWWIIIDASARDGQHQITTGHIVIGIFGTISFCMINSVKREHIYEENGPEPGARIAKILFLIGFVMGFASIIAAIWVMVDDFVKNDKKDTSFGVAILLQNLFILISSVVYKFGRTENINGMGCF